MENEKKIAFWRIIGLVVFVLMVGILGLRMFETTNTNLDAGGPVGGEPGIVMTFFLLIGLVIVKVMFANYATSGNWKKAADIAVVVIGLGFLVQMFGYVYCPNLISTHADRSLLSQVFGFLWGWPLSCVAAALAAWYFTAQQGLGRMMKTLTATAAVALLLLTSHGIKSWLRPEPASSTIIHCPDTGWDCTRVPYVRLK